MKYRPDFPDRIGSLDDGRGFCTNYFDWYNNHHHHRGLGFLTPVQVHHGLAPDLLQPRQAVLDRAHEAHPERFPRGAPAVVTAPPEVRSPSGSWRGVFETSPFLMEGPEV
jgi:putative transposase